MLDSRHDILVLFFLAITHLLYQVKYIFTLINSTYSTFSSFVKPPYSFFPNQLYSYLVSLLRHAQTDLDKTKGKTSFMYEVKIEYFIFTVQFP